MDQEHAIAFGPFRLETTPGRLWQGDRCSPCGPGPWRCWAIWWRIRAAW